GCGARRAGRVRRRREARATPWTLVSPDLFGRGRSLPAAPRRASVRGVEPGQMGGVVEAVEAPAGQAVAGVAEVALGRLVGPLGQRRVLPPHVERAPQGEAAEGEEGPFDDPAVAHDDHRLNTASPGPTR